jgi:DNA-directed RNA polymerase subunit E'/Rpb7
MVNNRRSLKKFGMCITINYVDDVTEEQIPDIGGDEFSKSYSKGLIN